MKNGIATSMSPSFKMVSKYFSASVLSFLILTFLLFINYDKVAGHYFQPQLLALVHIATLGWISMIIFGALFQLIPVVLEVKLFSEKLAEAQFWIYSIGTTGLTISFWNGNFSTHLSVYASILMLAILLFTINLVVTLFKVKKMNLTAAYLAAAIFYFFITGAAGLLLSINLGFPFINTSHLILLKAHAHVAFIGWITMIIMGVAYKLIPMFSLSHNFSFLPAKILFVLINLGLIGLTVDIVYAISPLLYFASVTLLIISILLFLLQIGLILKKRIRKLLDLGLKYSIIAFAALFIVTLIGLFLIWTDNIMLQTNVAIIYGFLIIFAYISLLIKAQMYKIFPFLVWFHKYSKLVGLKPVPMLKDMFNEKHAIYGFSFFITGIIIATAGIFYSINIIQFLGFGLIFLSAIVFTRNMIIIFKG
jgi:hypothetical protein